MTRGRAVVRCGVRSRSCEVLPRTLHKCSTAAESVPGACAALCTAPVAGRTPPPQHTYAATLPTSASLRRPARRRRRPASRSGTPSCGVRLSICATAVGVMANAALSSTPWSPTRTPAAAQDDRAGAVGQVGAQLAARLPDVQPAAGAPPGRVSRACNGSRCPLRGARQAGRAAPAPSGSRRLQRFLLALTALLQLALVLVLVGLPSVFRVRRRCGASRASSAPRPAPPRRRSPGTTGCARCARSPTIRRWP